jgi:hypothetical protein
MKNYFTRVEDNYVFRISTAFWHILIGLLSVAAVAGIVFLCWSLIPPSKEKIKAAESPVKPQYPPSAKVTIADLTVQERREEPVEIQTPPPPREAEAVPSSDPDKAAYDLLLAELKKIIPQESWQHGYWDYPYGRLAFQMYPSNPHYKVWVAQGGDVPQELEGAYRRMNLENYGQKKSVLASFLRVIRAVPQPSSYSVLLTIMENVSDRLNDLNRVDSIFKSISVALNTFQQSPDAAGLLIRYSMYNRNDCFVFMNIVSKTCAMFPADKRLAVATAISDAYYRYYNNNIQAQKEATDEFITLIPQIGTMVPDYAIMRFYLVYNQKNQQRNLEIARIDEDYNLKIQAIYTDSVTRAQMAEMNYMMKKEKKSELRVKSYYVILGGFVAIALLGTILTLLSIQRILRKMERTSEINPSSLLKEVSKEVIEVEKN